MGEADPQAYSDIPEAEVQSGGSLIGTVMNWVGALTSVALIAGLAVWGYKLTVRDVTGIPVVRALEGPMRVQPDDPGGTEAAHQGLAVNAVQADGMAEAPADRLVLAPAPVDLSTEPPRARPTPNLEEAAADATPGAEAADTELAETTDLPLETTLSEDGEAEAVDPVAAALALADEIAAETDPLEPLEEPATEEVAADPGIVPVGTPGVSRSPRPAGRPDRDLVAQAAAEAVRLASAPAESVDVDPASLAPGTRLVQLGAFDSADVAQKEWDRLASRFGDFMVDKKRVIQKAQSGGRTFYRLRAMGFADINDARRFCSALLAENAACIPVVTR